MLRVERHRAQHDRVQRGRDRRPEGRWPRRRRRQPRQGDGGRPVPGERALTGQRLVQHDAQGVDVRGHRGRLAACLLRAEVVHGPHRRARQRELRFGERPGDPEIRHLDPAVTPDQHVRRLHVAMDDAADVGGMERLADLGAHPGGLSRGQRPGLADDRRQVLALDQLHHDVRPGVVLAEVVDGDDVGVAQRRSRTGLVAEPGQEVGVASELGPQQLDGDVALELRVARAIDPGHAALSEKLQQAVSPAEDASDLGHGLVNSMRRSSISGPRASYSTAAPRPGPIRSRGYPGTPGTPDRCPAGTWRSRPRP